MQVCWGLEPDSTRAGKPLQALSLTFSSVSQGFPWMWACAWQLQELISISLSYQRALMSVRKHRAVNFHAQRELKTHLEEHRENAICPLLKTALHTYDPLICQTEEKLGISFVHTQFLITTLTLVLLKTQSNTKVQKDFFFFLFISHCPYNFLI